MTSGFEQQEHGTGGDPASSILASGSCTNNNNNTTGHPHHLHPQPLDSLALGLDDSDGLNAITLTILNSGVEEALSSLSPEQLMLLERNVERLKKQKSVVPALPARRRADAGSTSGGISGSVSRKRRASDDDEGEGVGGVSGGVDGCVSTSDLVGSAASILDLHHGGIPDAGEDLVGCLGDDCGELGEHHHHGHHGHHGHHHLHYHPQTPRPPSTCAVPGSGGGGQYMNLPASTPHTEIRDGIDYLVFTYSTKGHVQEYCIRIDVDSLTLDDIPGDFKHENCVYPRALSARETYTGNRYDYETNVNELAWKLTWLNAAILAGKRGLIQRAVDSYRNRTPASRSRRVLRQEKLTTGSGFRRRPFDALEYAAAAAAAGPGGALMLGDVRSGEGGASSLEGGNNGLEDASDEEEGTHQQHHHQQMRTPTAGGSRFLTMQLAGGPGGEALRLRIRVDVESVDASILGDDFRRVNCVYPAAFTLPSERVTTNGADDDAYAEAAASSRWEYETACNDLAARLAWLNASKLAGNAHLLHRAVDAYRGRFGEAGAVLHHMGGGGGSSATPAARMHHHQPGSNDDARVAAGMAAASGSMHLPQQQGGPADVAAAHHQLADALLGKNAEFTELVAQTLQQALLSHGSNASGDLGRVAAAAAVGGGDGAVAGGDASSTSASGMIDPSASSLDGLHQLAAHIVGDAPHSGVADLLHHHHHHHHHHHAQQSPSPDTDDEHPQTVSTAELLGGMRGGAMQCGGLSLGPQ